MNPIKKFYLLFLGLMLIPNCFSDTLCASKQEGGLCTVITQSILKSCSTEVLTYQKKQSQNVNLSKDFCPYIANKVCTDCCSDLFLHIKKTNKNKFSKGVIKEADSMCVKACHISPPKSNPSTKENLNKSGATGPLPEQSVKQFDNSTGAIENSFTQQEQENFRATP